MSKLKDLTGHRYGRLTVLRRGRRRAHNAYWLCLCDCGLRKQVRTDALQRGHTTSCGCYADEVRVPTRTIHGHCHSNNGRETPEYSVYHRLRSACNNPKSKDAEWYRGLRFLFSNFVEFLADVGLKPGDDYWLMRIDRSEDIAPGNLHWVPIKRHRKRRRRKQRLK